MSTSSPRMAPRLRSLLFLLGVLVLLQFGYPVTLEGPVWTAIYMTVYAGMVVAGIRVIRGQKARSSPFFALGIFVAVAGTWFAFNQGDLNAQSIMLASIGLFQLALLGAMFRFIMWPREGISGTELLIAAVSAYLLMGGVFGVAFSLLETAAPGSFADATGAQEPLVWQGLLYASYVTLATLGFGEILPVTPWARSLVSFETIVGTLFLAVVIARLVGGDTGRSSELEPGVEPEAALKAGPEPGLEPGAALKPGPEPEDRDGIEK